MSILPRFAHTSGAELKSHRVPQHVIACVEQHRYHLQRTVQDQNEFRSSLRSGLLSPLSPVPSHPPELTALNSDPEFESMQLQVGLAFNEPSHSLRAIRKQHNILFILEGTDFDVQIACLVSSESNNDFTQRLPSGVRFSSHS